MGHSEDDTVDFSLIVATIASYVLRASSFTQINDTSLLSVALLLRYLITCIML